MHYETKTAIIDS